MLQPMQRVVAKISIPTADGLHHQLFRFQFESADQRFNELCQFIQQKYRFDFVLRYKDDEGEMITIANEGDVTEAFETAQSMNSMLKVYVRGMKELNEPTDLEVSMEMPDLLDDDIVSYPVVEESPERSQAPDLPDMLVQSTSVSLPAVSQEMPLVSFEEPAPQPDPMERLFVATKELLKVYRSRFGVLLLIELNKILQVREIHPKNYPAEIAMIINTQNEFSDVLQNPLYLDVVGPALFKVILPDEFIIRVNANASLLKQLDARSIAEYASTMISSLCASAGDCKVKFALRPPNLSFAPPVASVVPVNLDPLEPAPVREENPQQERGILSTVLNWSWAAPPKEDEPVPFVEPDAPVVAPPRNAASTDFDILSFVDESLENAREDEKAAEERPSLVVTPASHVSYREADDVGDDDLNEVREPIIEDEPLEDEDVESDSEELAVEIEIEVDDDEADDLKQSVMEEEEPEPRGRRLTHPNSLCSLCGMQPITGLRYKCMVCSDMHMCGDCEKSGLHDRSHPVLKFATATQRLYAPHELTGLRDLIDPQYHTMFFTDIPVDRAGEDAMNMSTYSAVSAASINPILMMRYMAQSLRNPAALSRILDPIPNEDDESVSSASEFEVDVTVEEDVPDVCFQERPNEPSAEPEIEFPQDDDFEIAEVSTDEVDFDVKVDADEEPVVAGPPAQPVIVETIPEPAVVQPAVQVMKDEQVEDIVPKQPEQPPQPQVQRPQRPPVARPPQQIAHHAHQYPSMYNYQFQQQQQYYPGMPYTGQGYQAAYQPYNQYQPYGPPQQQYMPHIQRVPVSKPPPLPKQEEELNDDFLLESQPEAPKPPAPLGQPAKPVSKPVAQQPVVKAQPQPKPQPRVQPSVQPPAAVQPPAKQQPVAPSQNYVPPVVSNLPAYPILKAPEEKAPPSQPKPAKSAVEEDALSCFCGVPLVKMPIGDLGSVVQCDVCNVKVTKGDVYHCFEQSNHGSGGYDLCVGCVNHQIAASRNDRLPQTTHAGPDPREAVAPSAPPAAPPSAMSAAATTSPAIPPELEPHRKYKFFNGLVSLNEMGIGDVETNKKLLKIHKGNVSAVMQQYFDGNVSGYHY